MKNGIQVKVCGLTRKEDVQAALEQGVDACGFIAYPDSPRVVTLEQAQALAAPVAQAQKVVVDVAPALTSIQAYQAAGFQKFQIHASLEVCEKQLPAWAELVGRDHLWIAPRLPQGTPFPKRLTDYASTVVMDTYASDKVGGTGVVGDWKAFRELQATHPQTRFILAGGLAPDNIQQALQESGARYVDLNSGIERAPGVKDPALLADLIQAIVPLEGV